MGSTAQGFPTTAANWSADGSSPLDAVPRHSLGRGELGLQSLAELVEIAARDLCLGDRPQQ